MSKGVMNAYMVWKIDPVEQFEYVRGSVNNKAMRISMNKAAVVVKNEVIAKAPKDYGYLAKATKIRTRYKKNTQVWYAVVGASVKFKRNKKKKPVFPANYQSLVDQGTKYIAARRYLEAAYMASRDQYLAVLKAKLKEQLQQAISS